MSVFKEPSSLLPEFEEIDLGSDCGDFSKSKTSFTTLKTSFTPIKNHLRNCQPKCKNYSFTYKNSKEDSNVRLVKCTPLRDEAFERELFLPQSPTSSNVATVEVEIHQHKLPKKKKAQNLPEDPDAIHSISSKYTESLTLTDSFIAKFLPFIEKFS